MENTTIFSGIQFNWFAAVAAALCLTMAAPAFAKNANPCAEDTAKLCPGVKPGEGRLVRCIKEHANELSPACREAMAESKQKVQDFSRACKESARKLCEGTKPGGGRILQCLKQHEAELTPECKEKMVRPKGRQ
jgi:hypothetical protein